LYLSYVSKTLIPGESIVHEATISLWTQTPLILLGLILLPVFGIGLIFWVMAYVRYKSTELAVTTKRTVAKFGFVSRHTMEMNLSKIETIQVTQSLLGRVFDFGSLIISGAGIPQEPIPGIGQPMEFRRAVLEAQEEAASRQEARSASVKANRDAGWRGSPEKLEKLEAPVPVVPFLTYRQRIIVRIVGTTLMFFFLAWLFGAFHLRS
jgi:uncharacterized membrane protein YdbT with pleckstrin-like domain